MRFEMLVAAGFEPQRLAGELEDSALRPDPRGAKATCVARAAFKAAEAQVALRAQACTEDAVILAADTLCAIDERLLGKPTHAAEARAMIQSLQGQAHETITGVALVDGASTWRSTWCDSARVQLGVLDDDELDRYIASGQWRGRAGGYNLQDRVAAGWPITCEGDPTTVMGLPMNRLAPMLERALAGESLP